MDSLLQKLVSIVVLISFWNNGIAQAQEPTEEVWGGCGTNLVTIGDPTTICLVLANGTDWQENREYLRLNFKPTVDDYTRFHVPRSFEQLIQNTGSDLATIFPGNVTLHVASQRAFSYQRVFYDGFDKIFPHLTAIIDVREGVVRGIAWDDACLFCTKSRCQENTYDFNGFRGTAGQFRQPTKGCYIEQEECVSFSNDGRTDCDILLYVVWTGTDSKGAALQSSGFRFSAFPAQELEDRFSQNLPDLPTFGSNEEV